MSLFQRCAILGVATWVVMAPGAWAQQSFSPRIGYVYPAGGQQGTEFQVTLGGQSLDGVTNVFVTGSGVQAKVLEHIRPITVQQAQTLKEKLKELQEKKQAAAKEGKKVSWSEEDEKTIADIRKKLSTFIPKTQINPALVETVTLQVSVAPDAEPGKRDLRLQTPQGLTNPRAFYVGQLPEYSKKPGKIVREFKGGMGSKPAPTEPETTVTLPVVINGQIMQGAVDRFRFQARKDQRLVIAANARELIPYLPDAVPGWFQATLVLRDSKGQELEYADHYEYHPDPVLYYKIPEDGEYTVEIRDSIYRGREDFVYRITVGELPYVTSIFPLGGIAGDQTSVELKGWNLPMAKLAQDGKGKDRGLYQFFVRKEGLVSNLVPFALDTLPECLEKEPNNDPEHAQAVTLPVIVNGRIDKPGDWDIFRFDGHSGDAIVAEVLARRLNSPLDSVLKLTDAAGKQLAFNDDHEDKGSGLNTHHADSYLTATLPADGVYYLHLGDTQHQGGPEFSYRLRISAPRPDFDLRVVPSSINARPGSTVPITAYALRKDGFNGPISIHLKGMSKEYVLTSARLPAGQDQVRFTLTVPSSPLKEPVNLSFEGQATIQGHEVSRMAMPAEDMMQAFAYRHLVLSKEMKLTVGGKFAAKLPTKILSSTPIRIPVGGTANLQVSVPASLFQATLHLELSEPPEGISLKSSTPARGGTDLVLQSDPAKVKPGQKGNLIVMVLAEKNGGTEKGKALGNQRRYPLTALPAVPFEIVQP